MLATGSSDQTVKLWQVGSKDNEQSPKTLSGHTGQVWSVAFSPTSNILASGADDGANLLWNTQAGTHLKTLRSNRPYEHMNIYGATGITEAQKTSLKALGALENGEEIGQASTSAQNIL